VERKRKAYNRAIRKRALVNHTAGKEHKNYKTPQVRYPRMAKNVINN